MKALNRSKESEQSHQPAFASSKNHKNKLTNTGKHRANVPAQMNADDGNISVATSFDEVSVTSTSSSRSGGRSVSKSPKRRLGLPPARPKSLHQRTSILSSEVIQETRQQESDSHSVSSSSSTAKHGQHADEDRDSKAPHSKQQQQQQKMTFQTLPPKQAMNESWQLQNLQKALRALQKKNVELESQLYSARKLSDVIKVNGTLQIAALNMKVDSLNEDNQYLMEKCEVLQSKLLEARMDQASTQIQMDQTLRELQQQREILPPQMTPTGQATSSSSTTKMTSNTHGRTL